MNYTNKTAFITGGTSGIGLAFAGLLAKKGANIFAFSMDDQKTMDEAVAQMKSAAASTEQRFQSARLDVSDEKAVEKVMSVACKEFGAPYFLINSAGIGGAVYFENLSYERFDRTVKINLYGTRNTTATVLPFMKEKGGYICNVSSFSGLVGIVGYTAYASSKFAVVGFSQSLRSELLPYNISVSVLCPPQVDTPLLKKTDPDKPIETKTINNNAGILSADYVAEYTLDEMEKGRFVVIPGAKARVFYLLNRLMPSVREAITERLIRKVRKGAKK